MTTSLNLVHSYRQPRTGTLIKTPLLFDTEVLLIHHIKKIHANEYAGPKYVCMHALQLFLHVKRSLAQAWELCVRST